MFSGSPRSGEGNSFTLSQPRRGSIDEGAGVAVCACAGPMEATRPINRNRNDLFIAMLRELCGHHRYYPQLNDLRQEAGGDAALAFGCPKLVMPGLVPGIHVFLLRCSED